MALENDDRVSIHTEVEAEQVADAIADGDHEVALEIIKRIDGMVADWDFTLALCDYFDEQRKAWAKEQALDTCTYQPCDEDDSKKEPPR